METVYRRVIERLVTADAEAGAFRSIVDGWFYALEQDVLAESGVHPVTRPHCWRAPSSCWSSG